MTAWAMAHPWMTVACVLFGLIVLDDIITCICNTINKCYITSMLHKKERDESDTKEKSQIADGLGD